MNKIGKKISRLREKSGISQAELADELGISVKILECYETDMVEDIPLHKLVLLSKIFEVSTDYILGLEDHEDDELTFSDIRSDMELDVQQTKGADDPMFSIIYGWRYFFTEQSKTRTVIVSVYKKANDGSYHAEVQDYGHLLGNDFVPTKAFLLSCITDLIDKCDIHLVGDEISEFVSRDIELHERLKKEGII